MMNFWKVGGILLPVILTLFFGYDFFFGEGGVVAAGDTIDALQAQLMEKDLSLSAYETRLAELTAALENTKMENDEAVAVFAEANETLTELLLSGAKAYRVGEGIYTYTVQDGAVTILGYIGKETKASVPSAIDGIPVVRIGKEAFRETGVREVILPSTVKHIDWFAFSGCYGLLRITVPESVAKIEYGAFDGCSRNLVLVCSAGSYAERYAKSYGLSVEAP